MTIIYKSNPLPGSTKEYMQVLLEFGKDNYNWQQNYWWYMIFYKEEKIIRKVIKPKEQIEEKLYYNESFVKWACSYYKDIEEKFRDWREARKQCGKFKPFTDKSEKVTWNKISKFPKPVVEEMLDIATTQSYGRLYDLESYQIEKIMWPLREQKRIEESKLEWFIDEEEKKKAELERNQINSLIKSNPKIREEAEKYMQEKFPKLEWMYKEKMLTAKMASIAKYYLNNK